MRQNAMRSRLACAWASMILPGLLSLSAAQAGQTPGTPAKDAYARMAPVDQYLMERNAEITLARSAAPEAISRDATVLVLGKRGFETAVKGKNGFVCLVERGWIGSFDWREFYNPKVHGADCLNPPAVRSILPIAELRTELVMSGRSQAEIIEKVRAALGTKQLPALEPGAMSYMMSKDSYLTDDGEHNGPHLMFYMPLSDPAAWGAVPGSPVASGPFWFFSDKSGHEGFPPLRVFTVSVGQWSDGSKADKHLH